MKKTESRNQKTEGRRQKIKWQSGKVAEEGQQAEDEKRDEWNEILKITGSLVEYSRTFFLRFADMGSLNGWIRASENQS